MEKKVSKLVKAENIKIETDRYYSEDDVRHDVVKLTHISTGVEATFDSIKGQVYSYNRALELMEEKIRDRCKKAVEELFIELFEEE